MNDDRHDGAGNMAGRLNGASSLIRAEHEKALYVYCMNHRMNLCVANTCGIPLVRNMMDVVKKISDCFNNSPQQYLISKIEAMMPNTNHTVLIDVCRTRWIERIDGFDRIVELLFPVKATFEEISSNQDALNDGTWNPSSRNDAQAMISAITSFSFIVALVVVKCILGLTRPPTVKLQKAIDLLKAKNELALLIKY